MSARNAYRVPGRRGGGPQDGRNKGQVHRNVPGRFEVRLFQPQKNDREIAAAQRGNTGNLGARLDLVALTYCEKGSSTLTKYLRDFVKGIRLICGIIFGTLFDFERSGNYLDFEPTELITQKTREDIQAKKSMTKVSRKKLEWSCSGHRSYPR